MLYYGEDSMPLYWGIGYIIKLIYINEREIKDETEGKNSSIIYGSNDNTINSY